MIIPKPNAHLHSMQKTSAKFQNNWWKTVRGVAPTKYPLSIYFDSISCKKNNNNQSIIPKPHAHLHFMQKTYARFQNNRWKTVRGIAPTRYPLSIHNDHCLFIYFHTKPEAHWPQRSPDYTAIKAIFSQNTVNFACKKN